MNKKLSEQCGHKPTLIATKNGRDGHNHLKHVLIPKGPNAFSCVHARMREFVMGESHTVHHGVSMEHLLGLITPHPTTTHWFSSGFDPREQDHMGVGGRVIKTACANKQFN